jgi:hypothetical protein
MTIMDAPSAVIYRYYKDKKLRGRFWRLFAILTDALADPINNLACPSSAFKIEKDAMSKRRIEVVDPYVKRKAT